MAALEIIGIPQSTYVRVVRMVCEEKGVPYGLSPEAPHSAPVSAIHPLGKVPVMRHGDVELCESKAIATYIDRVFDGPKLIPEDPKTAAQVEQWVSIGNAEFDKVMIRQYVVGYAFPKEPGKPDMKAIGEAAEKMKPQIAVLDRAVASGYLVGDAFTLADINMLPMLFYVSRLPEGAALVGETRNLKEYLERHSARDSFKNTAPPPPKKN